MDDDRARLERLTAQMPAESTIDRNAHAERILDVVRRALRRPPRPRSPYGASGESRGSVPEQEESP